MYTLQIKADDCLSEFSDPIQIVITGTEPGLQEGIFVYPTIVNNEVNVISKTNLKRIEILSVSGVVMKSAVPTEAHTRIEAQAFAPGLYLIRMTTKEDLIVLAKFVKH